MANFCISQGISQDHASSRWPVLAFVVWGELRPEVPRVLHGINDKVLHFSAYFILGAMAGGAIRQRGWVKWAVLGLIALGGVIEVIQAFVGRDPSLLDGITNGVGAIAGALLARFISILCACGGGTTRTRPRPKDGE